MITSEWKRLRFFSDRDNWGDPGLMVFDFVHLVDVFRSYHGCPMIVTCGTQGKHAPGSKHFIGVAGDFIFPNLSLPQLFERYLDATRFDFTGIGIYPHWKLNGKVVGGMHLERASSSQTNEPRQKRYWLRVPSVTTPGEDEQLAINVDNLRKWGFLG